MINKTEFVTKLLRYTSSNIAPDEMINEALEFLGKELGADRAYIFEENEKTDFDNTYEWCAEGVSHEIDNLQGLPYEIGEIWYDEFDQENNILIEDIEAYKLVSEPMYNVLKPQGINTLVAGPLELNDRYIGFFGVDNPPIEIIEDISDILNQLRYSISIMLRFRNGMRQLAKLSYEDQLTGVMNRNALESHRDKIDPGRSIGIIMCDVNGLKTTNDTYGHEAGDRLIADTAWSLTEVFGKKSVYRLGGDEFMVMVQGYDKESFANDIERAKELFNLRNVNVSMGRVFHANAKRPLSQMMKDADKKMYTTKKEYYEQISHNRRSRTRE